jgi:hypothetical protein
MLGAIDYGAAASHHERLSIGRQGIETIDHRQRGPFGDPLAHRG